MKNGLDADMQSMSQAEKTMLRYQYVMANSEHITSDFARTSDTFHNTLTRLKANFLTLQGTIGASLVNLFKPVLVIVNNAIVVINQFAKAIGDSLGKILGWKYEIGEGGAAIEDTADYVDDIGDAAGGAGKAVKDLKKQLQGFDELNNLTSDDDNGGGGRGSGYSGLGAGGSSARAGQWVETEKLYDSEWDTWFKLGRGIGDAWADGLKSINWDDVYAGATGFGTGLADFLNGLITPNLFGTLGTTIANSLNTVVYGAMAFGDTLDWSQMGDSIAAGVNGFMENYDFSATAGTINKFATGILDMLITAVDNIKWDEFGTALTDFITGIDLPDIATKMSTLAIKLIDGLGDAIISADWKYFGEQLGEAIKNLNIPELAMKLIDLAGKIIGALGEAIMGLMEKDPLSGSILMLIAGAKLTGLSGVFGGLLSSALGGAGATITLPAGFMPTVVLAGVTWLIGENIGNSLGEAIAIALGDWDLAEYYANFKWSDFFETVFATEYDDDPNNTITSSSPSWEETRKNFNENWKVNGGDVPYSTYPITMTQNYKGFNKEITKATNLVKYHTRAIRSLNIGLKEVDSGIVALTTHIGDGEPIVSNGLELINGIEAKISPLTSGFGNFGQKIKDVSAGFETGMTSMQSAALNNFSAMSKSALDNSNSMKTSWIGAVAEMVAKTNAGTEGMVVSVTNWGSKITAIVSGTQPKASFSVEMTPESTVSTQYNKLSGIWKSKTSAFKVDPTATAQSTVTSAWNDRAGKWSNKIAGFSVDATKTPTKDITSAWDERSGKWQSKAANFSVNAGKTLVSDVSSAWSERAGKWNNKAVGFTIDSQKTATSTVEKSWSERAGKWISRSASFTVDSTKTDSKDVSKNWNDLAYWWRADVKPFTVDLSGNNSNSVKSTWDQMSYWWQDKTATFSLNFSTSLGEVGEKITGAVSKGSVNTWIGSLENRMKEVGILAKDKTLPRLATGGVVDRATLAMIGEAGAEAVVPLEKNTQWLGKMADMLAQEMAYKEYTPPAYGSATYNGSTSYSGSATASSRAREEAIAEQNMLLREEIALLRQIAEKDLTIGDSDIFNATRRGYRSYVDRTGDSPFM